MDAGKGLITITEKAASKLRELMSGQSPPAAGLRVAVVRTGCMGGRGFANRLAFEEGPGPGDETLEQNGIRVYVDPVSARYLRGTQLDYIDTPADSGFQIQNPNVRARCPCGHHDIFE